MNKHFIRALRSVAAAARTYATWNPADTHASITLSNGNLTAGSAIDYFYLITRATIGFSAGRKEWSVTVGAVGTGEGAGDGSIIGIATAAHALQSQLGSSAEGWGYRSDGSMRHGGGDGTGATYTTGDVISFVYEDGTLQVYKNAVLQKTWTGITGTVYPATCGEGGWSHTADFGESTQNDNGVFV